MKAWPILGILIVQAFLCLAHWFLYCTWIDFWWPLSPAAELVLRIVLILLSASFMAAALLGFRFSNWLVALIYQIAAVWLGLLNFFFVAACLAWVTDFALRFLLSGAEHLQARPYVAAALLIAAVVASLYGALNSRWVRVRRVAVRLEKLPPSWHGRTALVASDLHLGNINGVRFARRIAAMARRLDPDVIFIPGDVFDGTKADPDKLAAPLYDLAPPLGMYFVSGNHEEFGGSSHYAEALRRAGIRVLENERVVIDDLHVVGVPYSSSTYPLALRNFLLGLRLNDGQASILLQHVPNRLPIVEEAGVSLQLSGHTHGGQVFFFTWITRRAFGKFTYGLQQFGALQVYTSSGAGTWGPPMRVGTHPEIVLLTFE
ncbi:MAG: metallophosphoesterase [Terracidiphilus sp.]